MSLFVFGYFTMLIAGSSMAVYYKRNEAFGVLFTVTLASMLLGILFGQVAFWTITVIFICLAAAGGWAIASAPRKV
jgi:hypothetical protein